MKADIRNSWILRQSREEGICSVDDEGVEYPRKEVRIVIPKWEGNEPWDVVHDVDIQILVVDHGFIGIR